MEALHLNCCFDCCKISIFSYYVINKSEIYIISVISRQKVSTKGFQNCIIFDCRLREELPLRILHPGIVMHVNFKDLFYPILYLFFTISSLKWCKIYRLPLPSTNSFHCTPTHPQILYMTRYTSHMTNPFLSLRSSAHPLSFPA